MSKTGMASRTAAPPCLAALGLLGVFTFLALAGHAAAVAEVEPNDDLASANPLAGTGSYVVSGNTSNASDAADYFRVNLTSPSVVEVIIASSWGCAGASCENVSIVAPNGSVLVDPFGDPMNGTDEYFSGLGGAWYFIRVAAGTPGGAYAFTVHVYPFNYSAGAEADVTEANRSSAIVAFAVGTAKTSVHPYDLQLEGEGVYYGAALKLFLVNVGPLDLTVVLPAGLIWRPEDARYTSFVVTRQQFVTIPAWTYDSVLFVAASLNPYGWVPRDPSRPNNDPSYYIGPMAGGNLGKITAESNQTHYSYQAEQIAVWAEEAGQSDADFFNLGASTSAKREAVNLLNHAGVHTSINPTSPFSWLSVLFGGSGASWTWPCFLLLFFGMPILFGLSRAVRAMRFATVQIDGAYSVNRSRAGDARRERRDYVREMRRHERERHRMESEARRLARVRGEETPAANQVVVVDKAPEKAPPLNAAHAAFLAMDAEEHFDLDGLNLLDFNAVVAGATGTKALAAQTSKKADELLKRLRQDVGDPDTIDDILRDRLVEWYRESPKDQDWAVGATRAWSGLVAESKAAGGRKRAPLEKRISDLKATCDAVGKWFKGAPKPDEPTKPGQGAIAVDPAVVKEQVVQAVLDDLAAAPKASDTSHPLPVLSELAAKLTPQRVNGALAEMFKADPRGPYVVLHPSRYPDFDITVIRPPAQGAKAGAMAYDVFFAKAQAQAAAPQTVQGAAGNPAFGSPTGMLDTTGALWGREKVSGAEWSAVLAELQRQRQRLDAPPPNYRKLPPYFTLRELLLADDAARRAFVAVKWRGKPVGLALIAQLFLDKTLTPDIDTDREYFEAELGDIERGDTSYQPPAGRWTLGAGVVVSREGDAATGFVYRL